MKESTRHYIYKVLLAAQPLVAAYGIMAEETSVLWLSFASAVLATGLATKNTSKA